MNKASGHGQRMLIVFAMPPTQLQRIQAAAPGLQIEQWRVGDAGYKSALQRADIIVGWPPVGDLQAAQNLKWLQIASAGVNRYAEALAPEVILTNAKGVFGVPIAEHILAMMLALARGLPAAIRAATQAQWQKPSGLQELYESTCGIIGLGDIGMALATRAQALGMRVLAVKRTVREKPAGVDELWDMSGLDQLLSRSQHVVVTLPGTVHTKHLLNEERLRKMAPGSFIYNVGRGSVIDEEALVTVLQEGHLGGAGLDVFAQEPLPPESPLWSLANVIITPHTAGTNPRHAERLTDIVVRNLPRYLAGQPLENEVDRYWGY